MHYVKVNLGYKFDQDYSSVDTSPDQRYYSLKAHGYVFADFELEPTIYIPEKIDLTLTFSINQFFGSVFGEGQLWWGTESDSVYAVCYGTGYYLRDMLVQLKGKFTLNDCYKILMSDLT